MITKALNKFRKDGFVELCVAFAKYPFLFYKRKKYKKMLSMKDPKERFSEIYNKNMWLSGESFSGPGSEIAYTENIRKWLIDNIPRLKIKVFVDAPCGDFNWMKLVVPKVDIKYIGLDIVDSLVDINKSKYKSSNIDFKTANICEDIIPSCDLLMVRDCLFHLSYNDMDKFLKNLKRTDYKFLFTSTHIVENGFKNSDIISGDFRTIDLFSEPFNFDSKNISDRVDDYPKGFLPRREMILIEKKFVPTSLIFSTSDSDQ